VLRCVNAELAPGDLFIGYGTGVTSVASGRVADLAEVAPERDLGTLKILMEHRNDADRKVTRDSAANLEESDRAIR